LPNEVYFQYTDFIEKKDAGDPSSLRQQGHVSGIFPSYFDDAPGIGAFFSIMLCDRHRCRLNHKQLFI
jgi:hypothetical protein